MSRGKRKFDAVFILFSLFLGLFMGWAARDLIGGSVIGVIIGNIGIWVFVSALLAAYTPEAFQAALHVFVYFVGVIAGYYGNIFLTGGSLAVKSMVYWLVFALIGAAVGFIVWNSRAREWLGGICAAVPISLLAAEAWPIYRVFTIPLAFDVVCAVVLYILLAPGKYQKLMALPFIIIFTFALVYFGVFSRIFGGWI